MQARFFIFTKSSIKSQIIQMIAVANTSEALPVNKLFRLLKLLI